MFKKVNIKDEPPRLFLELLDSETKEFREKFHTFWKEAKYYDIYNKIIDGDAVSLAIVRMTKEDYETFMKEKSLENYLEEERYNLGKSMHELTEAVKLYLDKERTRKVNWAIGKCFIGFIGISGLIVLNDFIVINYFL